MTKFSMLAFLIILLCFGGCQKKNNVGRWDHYKSGGSFVGAKPEVSPDGKFIVYSSPSTGHGDIYIFDIELEESRQLTNSESYEGDPSWSSDSKLIVFVRENEDNDGRIWTMSADGKNQQQVSERPGYQHCPCFDFAGKYIAYSVARRDPSAYPTHIELIDRTNGSVRSATEGDNDCDVVPTFGDHENDIFFSRDSNTIYRLDVSSGQETRIEDGYIPKYSKSTNELFYTEQDKDYQIEIYRTNLTTNVTEQLTDTGGYKSGLSICERNGKIYYLKETNDVEIGAVFELDGSVATRLFGIVSPD